MARRERRSSLRRITDQQLLAALEHAEQCLLWIGGRWVDVPDLIRQRALACGHQAGEILIRSGYRADPGPLMGLNP